MLKKMSMPIKFEKIQETEDANQYNKKISNRNSLHPNPNDFTCNILA